MEIHLDGQPGLIAPSAGAKLGVVLAQVDGIVRGMGREVVEMSLDGHPIDAKGGAHAERSPEDFTTLVVRTMPQLAMVHALVERAASLLPSVEKVLPDRAAELKGGTVKDPAKGLQPVIDVLSLAHTALALARDVHLASGGPTRTALRDNAAALENILRAIVEAVGRGDPRAAGRLMSGELVPLLPKVRDMLAKIGPALPARPEAAKPEGGSGS